MALARPSSAQLAAGSVGLTAVGMVVGTALVLSATYRPAGWLIFIISFGGWLAAALLAMREGWHRGWFDR